MTPAFPPPSRRLRLGFVGGGQGLIGTVHANGARLSNRWEVTAGALSSDPDRALATGRAWMLDKERTYTCYRHMAACEANRKDGIDAVAIVTPNHLHAPVAMAFMDAGIDIISDKPLTATLPQARELVDRHRTSGLVYALTHPYAAHAMVRQAKAMTARGDIGDIRQIHVEYFQDWAMDLTDAPPSGGTKDKEAARGMAQGAEQGETVPWRLDPARSGPTFTVADIGTHAEHLARFVSGLDIQAVRADFHVTGRPKAMEDTAFMNLRFTGGVPGTLMVSQTMAGSQCGIRLRISGTKATLEWNQEEPETLHLRAVDQPVRILSRGYGAGMLEAAQRFVRMPRGHPEALTDAWANLYTEFALAVSARREGTTLPPGLVDYPTVSDGLKGMQFCDAALASHKSGSWAGLG